MNNVVTPGTTPPLQPSVMLAVTPTALAVATNTSATRAPSSTQAQTPNATRVQSSANPTAGVRVYENALNLLVYPYARYLTWSVDAATGVSFATFDRAAYERSAPAPSAQSFRAVILENEYLLLTVLPELGGRLYQVVYKPTNQALFYNNPVVKPSRFGPFDSDQNWWLATGGMEWAVPVQEHGYEWGIVWRYRTQVDAETASISLRDTDASDRLQSEITISIRRGEAAWTMTPQLRNPTARPMRVQFWLNAMLTLGTHSIASDTEFHLPATTARVHSTGDKRLPETKQTIAWPVYRGVDYSHYNQWQNWLGVFANELTAGSASAYNHQSHLGVRRDFPGNRVAGLKLFAFGPQFADRAYTDDESQYFELWGGPNKSFWPEDDLTLAPDTRLSWSETWSPFTNN